jgi:hypothetical protein
MPQRRVARTASTSSSPLSASPTAWFTAASTASSRRTACCRAGEPPPAAWTQDRTRSDGGGHRAKGRPPEGTGSKAGPGGWRTEHRGAEECAASGAGVSPHPAIWIRDAACTDVAREVDAARGGTADTGLGLCPGLRGQSGLSLL